MAAFVHIKIESARAKLILYCKMPPKFFNLPSGFNQRLLRRSAGPTFLLSGLFFSFNLWAAPDEIKNDAFEFRSVMVGHKSKAVQAVSVNLGSGPTLIEFDFSQRTNDLHDAMRVRYRLEGYEDQWHDHDCQMWIGVRFYNALEDGVGQKSFEARAGDSAGWRQSLETSPLTHRRELVTCPPGADHLWVVITSAGPPATVGTYVVANLNVFKMTTNGAWIPAMTPLDEDLQSWSEGTVRHWQRDGDRPSMAKVVNVGTPPQKALAIVDTDGAAHAEWHTAPGVSLKVRPGDRLLLEWDEMFSIGVCDVNFAHYDKLSAGKYIFHVECFDALDRPTGIQGRLAVLVPPPLWLLPWFWLTVGIASAALTVMVTRYMHSRRIRRELNWHRALEKERLRIAQDIHDDLGARLTEVSLKSALAKDRPDAPPAVIEDFEQISTMCRDLVESLYATVWTVNPENDNLHALGEFLCQIAVRLTDQAKLACRLKVPNLPKDIEISTGVRHNIAMSVTEAIHNVIKHAKATEVCLTASFEAGVFVVLVEDNGCGFDPAQASAGNGMKNMRDRLASVDGNCLIENRAGGGTTVQMRVSLRKRSLYRYGNETRL